MFVDPIVLTWPFMFVLVTGKDIASDVRVTVRLEVWFSRAVEGRGRWFGEARILQKPTWRPRPFEAEAVDVVWGVAVDERRRRNEATAAGGWRWIFSCKTLWNLLL